MHPTTYKLKNGVRVVLMPMLGVESVGVGVFAQTGSRYETPDINGISHFLEHMVFKGTKALPTCADTSKLEGLGAIQNAWTDIAATAYWCKIPADKWQAGLEVVKELALYPAFPKKDLEIERGVILEEINRRNDRPDELSQELIQKILFVGNPLEMTVLGQPEVIKKVTRENFVAYHQSHYTSQSLVVVLAGKIVDSEKVKVAIEKWFGQLKDKAHHMAVRFTHKQSMQQIAILNKQLANQAHLQIAVPGLTVSDERRFALSVLTTYLGQGLSSRLFTELREKRGLCYAVQTSEDRLEDTGVWSVYAGVSLDKMTEAISAILTEMKRLKEVLLTSDQLTQAKEKIRGPLLFSMENPIHQMDFYARQALDKWDSILSYDDILDRLMQTTAQDVQDVARDLFISTKLNLAIVGNVAESEKANLVKLLEV